MNEGGDDCLTVCTSQLAIFSSYCDKHIRNYEMVRGQRACVRSEKCTQKYSGKIDEQKKHERPSRRWHDDIIISLR